MKYTNGNIFWKKKDEIKNTYPYLTHDSNADVLIIGGGITGALTAYFLAKEGANIIVVEKNIIGYGSTIASSAMLEMDIGMDLYKLEKLIGKNEAIKMYNLYKNAIDELENIDNEINFDTGFSKKDDIYLSNKFMQKVSVLKEYQARKEAGFDTKLLDSHKILNLNTGILTKDSSAIINPYIFTQCLFEYLNSFENVNIYENTKIDEIKCGYENVTCKTNNGFKIESSKIVFTTGLETLKYIDNLQIELFKTFTIVTTPIKNINGLDDFVIKDMQEPNHMLRFSNDNRIIFTGENIKYNDRLNDDKYFEMIANDKYRKLASNLQKMLPNVDDISIEYAYNGLIGQTKDSLPIVDEMPGMPNCFCNLSLGKNSILGSIVGAKMLTNAVRGLYSKEMSLLRISR